MRTIFFILQKEFIQLFRNRIMVRIIILMPIVQLFILAYTATFEIKNIDLFVVDNDRSMMSRDLVSHFSGSSFYTVKDYKPSYEESEMELIRGGADQVLVISDGFEKSLLTGENPQVQVLTDAVNGSAASLMNAYSLGIIREYNQSILTSLTGRKASPPFKIQYSYWYNPELDYINYMVPGILVILVTIIGMFLSGMNLVREKEIGTIEQINVTPIGKAQFIAGKLIPYWILALAELAFGLILAKIAFDIPVLGNIFLVFGFAAVYLIVMQGMGLLISTLSNTQQQAMFLSWFFLVIFILMSGLFTPVESMPQWAQRLNLLNPIAYFIEAIRMILLKGSKFKDVYENFITLTGYGLLMLTLAIWKYRKVA